MPKYTRVWESYPDIFESDTGLTEEQIIDRSDSSATGDNWVEEELSKLQKPGDHIILGVDIIIRTE